MRFYQGAVNVNQAESMPLAKLINASNYAGKIADEENKNNKKPR